MKKFSLGLVILLGSFLCLPALLTANPFETVHYESSADSYSIDYEQFSLNSYAFMGGLEAMSCDGGSISADGQDSIYYCASGFGGVGPLVDFDRVNTVSPNWCYVVTDTNAVIVELILGDTVDFSTVPLGECWVWGVAWDGQWQVMPGDTFTTATLTTGCFDISDNYVVIYKDSVVGGTVATEAGTDTVQLCLNGPDTSVSFDSTGTAGTFNYVVTDPNGVILGLPGGDEVDFSGAGPGECWVWGLSYSGNVLAQVGDTASLVALTDGCYDLSSNYVVVFRDSVEGGIVSTEAGADTVSYCVGSGGGLIAFDSTGAFGGTFTYVVTDPNGVILGLPAGDEVDFSTAGPGECWVWGLSFTGNVLVGIGDTATAALTDGCYDLSDNYVVVLRDSVDGGTVATAAGADTVTLCLNAGTTVSFDSTDAFGGTFTYVVTDPNGVILGLPGSDVVDFAGAGPGECWVWGLSFTGNVLVGVGDTATTTLTDGCFDLSDNYVVVFRDSVDGGMVTTSTGADTVSFCVGSGGGLFAFDSTGTFGGTFTYVVTDPNGVILGLPAGDSVDFSTAGPGECWVWGLSFTGNVLVGLGDTATAPLTDGCYDLSDNYVVVYRDSVDGGTVATAAGISDTVSLCLNAGTTVAFDSTNAFGGTFTYVVTDPNGVILGLPGSDVVDFAGAGPGECWVWGLSFTGNVLVGVGDTANTTLTDGCFDLSDNYVVVLRDSVDGGIVSDAATGGDTAYVCLGMGGGVVSFDSMATFGGTFTYVVTDPNGVILDLPAGDSIDFSNAGPGECWVWGLSFTGNVLVGLGDTASAPLTDGCFDLSDNYVVVYRDSVEGGTVSSNGSDSAFVCLNMPGTVLSFDSAGTSGPNFAYVITDTATEILGFSTSDSIDFSAAGVGNCLVWGLSYSGNVLVSVGDTAAGAMLTDGCFDLSDNFVLVIRDTAGIACSNAVLGGTITPEWVAFYPVPAVDRLHISMAAAADADLETVVDVYDLSGNLLMRRQFQTNPDEVNRFDLDVERLDYGIYVLVCRNKNAIRTSKFMKQ